MKIKNLENGIEIHVDKLEVVDYFLKLALKEVKNKKPYQYSAAYATNFRIDVRFIENPPKNYLNKRVSILEKAKQVKITELMEEFRLTGTSTNKRLISQFCNIFKNWKDGSLECLLLENKEGMLRIRGVGPKVLDLFEQFLKSKGFTFATFWTGEKWV